MISRVLSWKRLKREVTIGQKVLCVVTHHCGFGALTHLVHFDVWGIIQTNCENCDYPSIGDYYLAEIIGFRDVEEQVELRIPNESVSVPGQPQVGVELIAAFDNLGRLGILGVDAVNLAIRSGATVTTIEAGKGVPQATEWQAQSATPAFHGLTVWLATGG